MKKERQPWKKIFDHPPKLGQKIIARFRDDDIVHFGIGKVERDCLSVNGGSVDFRHVSHYQELNSK
jgi:hypothetical protein